MRIWTQKSASVQLRTSLPKFDQPACCLPPLGHLNSHDGLLHLEPVQVARGLEQLGRLLGLRPFLVETRRHLESQLRLGAIQNPNSGNSISNFRASSTPKLPFPKFYGKSANFHTKCRRILKEVFRTREKLGLREDSQIDLKFLP